MLRFTQNRAFEVHASARRPEGPSSEQVRAQLSKILSDRLFLRSDRLRRFLTLTVERTLSGQTSEISEYALGREVFDRKANYDPRIDSIVRVEVRRLRNKLVKYYQEPGAADPVIIEFPLGSYVPEFRFSTPPAPVQTLNPRTVAVLPFLNISADPDQEYFCDGITEEILNALTGVAELNVVARTSVFHFKGATADVREIGARLGAGTLIEGSVRKADHSLRISVKMIDASNGLTLWSENFDRKMEDVFTLQTEIARAIAQALRVTIVPEHPPARNLESYAFFLRGRYYWNQRSQKGIEDALEQFTRAIALNPDYAPPYAALADAYGHLTVWGAIAPDVGAAKAKEAVLAALRLDDRLADAHATLGSITSLFEWRWADGEKLFLRALELQPSNVQAWELFTLALLCQGRFEQAGETIGRALRLDPLSSRGVRIKAWLEYYRREYGAAIATLREREPIDATSHEGQAMIVWSYIRQGRYDEAVALAEKLPEGPFLSVKLSALGEGYAYAGMRREALEMLRQISALAAKQYIPLRSSVHICCGLGDWDRVFADLETSVREHAPWVAFAKVDPRFDPVREDSRFVDLIRRMGLANGA